MPLFEFECPKCYRRIERMFGRVETADIETVLCVSRICPGMQQTVMLRVPTSGSFVLKGRGFYGNDYAAKK